MKFKTLRIYAQMFLRNITSLNSYTTNLCLFVTLEDQFCIGLQLYSSLSVVPSYISIWLVLALKPKIPFFVGSQ